MKYFNLVIFLGGLSLLGACVPEANKKCSGDQVLMNGLCVSKIANNGPEQNLDCGVVLNHQEETRIMYQSSSARYPDSCKEEVQKRSCDNGQLLAWSGSFKSVSCSNEKIRYAASSVVAGQSCQSEIQKQICQNGQCGDWSPNKFSQTSCQVQGYLSCGNVLHNGSESRVAYSSSSVAYGQVCIQQNQTRTCNNGSWSAWSGTYANLSCSVQAAAACGNIASGAVEMRTMYQAAAISEGQACVFEIQNRKCTNGQFESWSGTFSQPKCVISRIRYESATVNPSATCKSQTQIMTCENAICGVWIPNTFTNNNCNIIADASLTTSITQYGITWTFATPVKYGQFVNGDYWIVDPGDGVKITKIDPGDVVHTDGIRHMNGSMINPNTTIQGYDGAGDYDATKNVGIGISAQKPLILRGNVSLVSTISNLTPGGAWHVSYVKTAAVLTCLSSIPPTDSFRPGISAPNKTLLNLKNINYSLLKNYASPVTPPDISTLANQFQMVWLDHGDWRTRLMRPSDGIPENYYYTQYFASAALLLHLNYTLEQKKKLLINFMQLGIDLYSFLESGSQGWAPDGGNMNERKWPIMFAGIMLNYAPMKNIGFKSGDYLYANGHGPGNPPSDFVYFGEDGQTFYVAQSDIDITNSSSWHPDTRTAPNYPYTKAMLGMPEWGIRYSTSPSLSDASWNANYRTIGTGVSTWAGTSIAVRMMSAKTLWNHNSYFDYIDRYMAISKGDRDPFGYVVPGEKAGARATGFIGAMYDTYRNQF